MDYEKAPKAPKAPKAARVSTRQASEGTSKQAVNNATVKIGIKPEFKYSDQRTRILRLQCISTHKKKKKKKKKVLEGFLKYSTV
jgi:hypothetical protein